MRTPRRKASDTRTGRGVVTQMIADMIWGPAITVMAGGGSGGSGPDTRRCPELPLPPPYAVGESRLTTHSAQMTNPYRAISVSDQTG